MEVFDNLMSGLEDQLGGMGTAFASSLIGLAGSLVVGLLELFASHAQNRFYRELEEWLSSITKLGVTGVDPEEALTAATVLNVIGQTAEHIDALREAVEQGAARSAETEKRMTELMQLLASPRHEMSDRGVLDRLASGQDRLAASQERIAALLASREEEGGGGLDAEARARLRSIDTQVLRILEDLAAGRQDLVTEIRQDIAGLTEALRGIASRARY
jgi:hypothetical protein